MGLMTKIILSAMIIFSFSIPVSAWNKDDCNCDIGLPRNTGHGQGNTASCQWYAEKDAAIMSQIFLSVFDSYGSFDRAREEMDQGILDKKKSIGERKIHRETDTDDTYIVYYDSRYTYRTSSEGAYLIDAWGSYIRGYNYKFTVRAEDFLSLEDLMTKMQDLDSCIEKMTKARMDEQDLAKRIEKDESTPGSKGIDYASENKAGTFFWNIRNFLRGFIGKDTPYPWVEEAIESIGANDCESLSYQQMRQCYHDRAIEKGNHLVCEASYDIPACYSAIAAKNEDPTVCDKMREYIKWGRKGMVSDCYNRLSMKTVSVELCLKYPYRKEMESCLLNAAKETGDATICNRLDNADKCRVCAAAKSGDTSICGAIKNKKAKEACQDSNSAMNYCHENLDRLFQPAMSGAGTSSRG